MRVFWIGLGEVPDEFGAVLFGLGSTGGTTGFAVMVEDEDRDEGALGDGDEIVDHPAVGHVVVFVPYSGG